MNLRRQLRLSSSTQTLLERSRHHYPGRVVIERQVDTRYLQLQMEDEFNRQATAFLDIDCWLQNMDSHLPGMPWQHVPLSYLIRWLNTLQLSFLVEEVIWTVERITQPEKTMPNKLLSLMAEPCGILCIDWPSQPEERVDAGIQISRLPLNLRYILGSSQIPLSELTELVVGDLLLIKDPLCYLAIGQYKLFSFIYQGNDEVIVKESIFDNQQPERREEEHLLDWTKLPVDIEFVLDSNVITLGEINNIDVNSLIPVSSGSEQRIKIFVNRKLFAFGELVALEEGGLAVEVNKINMRPENKMDHHDVD